MGRGKGRIVEGFYIDNKRTNHFTQHAFPLVQSRIMNFLPLEKRNLDGVAEMVDRTPALVRQAFIKRNIPHSWLIHLLTKHFIHPDEILYGFDPRIEVNKTPSERSKELISLAY